jgi:hypothetical protein
MWPSNLPPYPSALPLNYPSSDHLHPILPICLSPSLSDLQAQLQDIQSSLATHVDEVGALEGVITEHDTIKCEIVLLRQLMEKSTRHQRDREREDEFCAETVGADDDMRRIMAIVPRELVRVEEEDEEQIAKQEREQLEEDDDDERRARRVKLGRAWTPEPMSLGITHLSEDEEDELRRGSSSHHSHQQGNNSNANPSVIDELFQRLTMLSAQLESVVELSSYLQAQHAAA